MTARISGGVRLMAFLGVIPIVFGACFTEATFDGSPVPVSASVSPGSCMFSDGVSSTPVTASLIPSEAGVTVGPDGWTIVLTKTGTGPVHTFPTSGNGYNAAPDNYTWVATATSGYELSGPSNGGFTAAMCSPPESSPSPSSARAREPGASR